MVQNNEKLWVQMLNNQKQNDQESKNAMDEAVKTGLLPYLKDLAVVLSIDIVRFMLTWWNGRHACLRCMWRELWEFESPRQHFKCLSGVVIKNV